jgi:hypothetical protein
MPRQGDLIPLTDEEMRARGPMLARMTLELEELKEENAETRKSMAAEEKELRLRIKKLAQSIRDGREKDQP